MIHLPDLIQDLGVILITAAVVTLLCKKLKQPVVLGYLIAGLLVGPYIPLLPTVSDTKSVNVWAEIGVIFLLFGLGLEFSFKKLAKVGKSASITAITEIVFMLGLGFLTGQVLGWSKMDSLFLGGILSISSTTIIVRAFQELGLKGRNFVSLVFGVLIVEDLAAILLLVLLSSMAVTQTLSGGELALSSLRFGFFMVLWFVMGIYLLPIIFEKIRKYLSDETMLVVSIGLCLLMVIIATKVGFSPALGAFVMGSLLAETREGHRIEHLMVPVRDLFAAVFFVSVGMLLNPQVLVEYFWVILLITLITIAGKLFSVALGGVLSGRSLKNSTQAGMSLAQIGEFSFIIATLGVSLKVTSDFLYPIAVAVSAVTTFTTPYMIKLADPFYKWLEARLPEAFKVRLARYESAMSTSSDENVLSLIWSEYGVKMVLNSVVIVAITLSASRLLLPMLENRFVENSALNTIACILTLILSGPFLWALIMAPPAHTAAYRPETVVLLRRLQLGISVLRLVVGVTLLLFVIGQFASMSAFAALILLILSILGVYFSRYSESLYQSIEKKFIANLTEKERDELAQKNATPELAPWNASLAEFTVSPNSSLIGHSLHQIGIKEKFGVTIAMIERGDKRVLAPVRTDMLMPYDRVYMIGTDEQLALIKPALEVNVSATVAPLAESFGLGSMILPPNAPFINKSIRECGLREAVNGLIVGIERKGRRILNPDSSMDLLAHDLVWIVGDLQRLKSFKSSLYADLNV
ncbi:MAG: cation:proton antiporter [Bdellovibrionales bacterium]